jgi:K+-sensing histidine kinase KdpD
MIARVQALGRRPGAPSPDRLCYGDVRVDRERPTHHRDGHGLGLSIVRAIAAAHGATITAHPMPQGGLRVQVSFPRSTNCDHAPHADAGTHPLPPQ